MNLSQKFTRTKETILKADFPRQNEALEHLNDAITRLEDDSPANLIKYRLEKTLEIVLIEAGSNNVLINQLTGLIHAVKKM